MSERWMLPSAKAAQFSRGTMLEEMEARAVDLGSAMTPTLPPWPVLPLPPYLLNTIKFFCRFTGFPSVRLSLKRIRSTARSYRTKFYKIQP